MVTSAHTLTRARTGPDQLAVGRGDRARLRVVVGLVRIRVGIARLKKKGTNGIQSQENGGANQKRILKNEYYVVMENLLKRAREASTKHQSKSARKKDLSRDDIEHAKKIQTKKSAT